MATVPDIFNDQNLVNLCRARVENLAGLENRREPWLVLLYAPRCCSCRVMEGSYVELSEKLAGSRVKFRADGERKAYAQKELLLLLGSFPTILFFLKPLSCPIKYTPRRREMSIH